MYKENQGFTLVELMVSVSIVGVLAAVAVPNFQTMQAKSRQSGARSVLSGIYTAEKVFIGEWGVYTTDFRNLGYCPEGRSDWQFGFGGPGVAIPVGYSGPGEPAGAFPTQYNSTLAQAGCLAITLSPRAAPVGRVFGTALLLPIWFFGSAIGNIDSDPQLDYWMIDNDNRLINGHPAFPGRDL